MKKVYYLIIFYFLTTVFFFLLTHSIAAGGFQGELSKFEKGIQLFHSGQYQQSYDLLLALFEEYPDHPELNFYLGRAAFETGQYEMAVMAYERILIAFPSENRVKLEMARTFHAMGANNTARQYCREVLESQPPEPVKENILAFLAVIDQSEQTHFLNGTLSFGVDWNNNVWATPSTGTIKTIIGDIQLTGASAQKTQDWIYSTTLSLDHRYRFLYSKMAWKTDALFYAAQYQDTSALDLRFVSALTGPEWTFQKNRASAKLLVKQIELGKTEYMNSYGVQASLNHVFSPGFLSRSRFRYEKKDFPGNALKDAENTAISFELGFPAASAWFGTGIQLEKEKAFDDQYSYERISATLSASKELPFSITAFTRYAYQYSVYDEAETLFTEKREDHENTVGLGLRKILWQSLKKNNRTLAMNLNYQHVWAFSNIDLYEYTQDLAQVSLAYHF